MSERKEACPRCERYGVLVDCDGARICEDCYGRLTPIERTPPTVWNVATGTSAVLGRVALPALVIAVATVIPGLLFQYGVSVGFAPLIDAAWGIFASAVMLHVAQRAIRGQPLAPERSVRAVWDSIGRLLLVGFVIALQLGLIATLFIALAIASTFAFQGAIGGTVALVLLLAGLAATTWRTSSLAVALPIELFEHPSSSALRMSSKRMKKRRGAALMFAICGHLAFLVPAVGWAFFAVAEVLATIHASPFPFPSSEPTALAQIAPAFQVAIEVAASAVGVVGTTASAVLYAKTAPFRVY